MTDDDTTGARHPVTLMEQQNWNSPHIKKLGYKPVFTPFSIALTQPDSIRLAIFLFPFLHGRLNRLQQYPVPFITSFHQLVAKQVCSKHTYVFISPQGHRAVCPCTLFCK